MSILLILKEGKISKELESGIGGINFVSSFYILLYKSNITLKFKSFNYLKNYYKSSFIYYIIFGFYNKLFLCKFSIIFYNNEKLYCYFYIKFCIYIIIFLLKYIYSLYYLCYV